MKGTQWNDQLTGNQGPELSDFLKDKSLSTRTGTKTKSSDIKYRIFLTLRASICQSTKI